MKKNSKSIVNELKVNKSKRNRINPASSNTDSNSARSKKFQPKKFNAPLERMKSRLNWIIIHLPFDAAKTWGSRGQIRVKGEINGFAFRTSLFPTGSGSHILLVNKKMQKGARATAGSVARFQLEPDLEERVAKIPPELLPLLNQDRALRSWFDGLNYSSRFEIGKWVAEPKGPEARHRRAEQMAERLLNVMDAERELPPMLRLAFARTPRAFAGWNAMSPSHRRAHLFGIFYYRTPDSQNRRIEKMLEAALAVAEKSAGRKH
jgi:uncharacterized protein YdeI (YjbR/CyaY-like superfamily)